MEVKLKSTKESRKNEIFYDKNKSTLSFKDKLGVIIPLPGNIRTYRVYTALLTQVGANEPTAVVLENTLGAVITYQYLDTGLYLAVSDIDLFTSLNEHVTITGSYNYDGNDNSIFQAITAPNSAIIISTLNGAFDDDLIGSLGVLSVFEIRVYN